MARQGADRLGDRPLVVVEDHQQAVVLERASIVQGLEGHAAPHRRVTHERDDVAVLSEQPVDDGLDVLAELIFVQFLPSHSQVSF